MMRWPRPPAARKFRARLVVRRAEELPPPPPSPAPATAAEPASPERLAAAGAAPPRAVAVAAEVRWKGPRASALGSLRRAAVRRNRTREDAGAAWEEEFESVVTLAAASQREGAAFHPWELAFCVFSVSVSSSLDSLLLSAPDVHTPHNNAANYTVCVTRWLRCSPVGYLHHFPVVWLCPVEKSVFRIWLFYFCSTYGVFRNGKVIRSFWILVGLDLKS